MPPHYQQNATHASFRNQRSRIYVADDHFNTLSAHQVQEIFRDRHILLPGAMSTNINFDRQGLLNLGCLTATCDIQGMFSSF